MKIDMLWELFRDTGDPVCWLLTRAAARPAPAAPSRGKNGGAGRASPP